MTESASLHLFHPCRFLLGPLGGPQDQGHLGDLELICQAEREDKQSANGTDTKLVKKNTHSRFVNQ